MTIKPFFKAETINNNCDNVHKYSPENPKKNFDFKNLKDTIINDTTYYHYELRCNKSLKYQKRRKILACNYIINKNQSLILPYLNNSTSYEKWKVSRNIPNGFPKMIYYSNLEGKVVTTYSINILKIDKYFTIPKECDYSENKND